MMKPDDNNYLLRLFTGTALESYIKSLSLGSECRDIVKRLIDISNANTRKPVLIQALCDTDIPRDFLQTIHKLHNEDNVPYGKMAYISINDGMDISCSMILNLFQSDRMKKVDYVFLNGATYLKNFVTGNKIWCELYTITGKRLFVYGVHTASICSGFLESWFHKASFISETLITYGEAKRMAGITFEQYIEDVNLYRADNIVDIPTLNDYITKAVIENIQVTFAKNDRGLLYIFEPIRNIDSKLLNELVFFLINSLVFSEFTLDDEQRINNIGKFLNNPSILSEDMKMAIAGRYKIDRKPQATDELFNAVFKMLDFMGFLITHDVMASGTTKKRYSFINHGVLNILLSDMIDNVDEVVDLKPILEINRKRVLIETILVAHINKFYQNEENCKIYTYHDKSDRIINIVVSKQKEFLSLNSDYLLFDFQFTDDADTAVLNSRWLRDPFIWKRFSRGEDTVKSAIIYTGTTQIFDRFTSSNLCPPEGITLEEIEKQNKGIMLISAEEFLLNPENFTF